MMVVICLPLPIALFLFARLSIKACSILNFLRLPWPGDVETMVHLVSGAIVLITLIALVSGLFVPGLRGASLVMSGYFAISLLAALFLLFVSLYGDPAVGCTPV